MKRDFLRNLEVNGAKLPEEVVEAIMAEYGKEKNERDGNISTLTNERDAWKQRAEKAEATLSALPKDIDPATIAAELEKAKTDLANAQADFDKKIGERDLNDALRTALDGIKFTSGAAKRDVEAQLREAGLTLKDGTLLGLNDMIEKLKKSDPDAFASDDEDKGKKGNDGDKGTPENPAPGTPGVRFTTKLGKDNTPKTKEEIMAVKDRKERRALIAENWELFKSEKGD